MRKRLSGTFILRVREHRLTFMLMERPFYFIEWTKKAKQETKQQNEWFSIVRNKRVTKGGGRLLQSSAVSNLMR